MLTSPFLNLRPKFPAVTAPPRSPPLCVPGLPNPFTLKPLPSSSFSLSSSSDLSRQAGKIARRSSRLPPLLFLDSSEGSTPRRPFLVSSSSPLPCTHEDAHG